MGPIAPIVIAAAVVLGIAGIVVALLQLRQGRLDTSPHGFLRLYLYTLAFASFVVFLFGAASLVTAGLATVAGKDFSYSHYSAAPPPPPDVRDNPKYIPPPSAGDQQDRQYRDDWVRGISLLLTGGLLWALHFLGIRATDPPEVRRTGAVASLYSGGLLAIAGLVTVVALPWGVYSLVAYYVLPQSSTGPQNQPGPILAFAFVFLPVLAYFLWRLTQRARLRAAAA